MGKPLLAALGAALILLTPAHALAQSAPADPAKLAEARAIMEIIYPPAERDQMISKMIGDVSAQARAATQLDQISDSGLREIVESYVSRAHERMMPTVREHLPRIIEATAIAYTHEFSLGELRELHAFAQTPSGRHYLSKAPTLIGDPAVAAANTAYLAEIQRATVAMREGMRAEVTSYLRQHPDVAAGVAPASRPARQ